MNAAAPQSTENWFLETALINQLRQKLPGIKIRSSLPADSVQLKTNDVLITYQILSLGISYEVPADKKLKNSHWYRTARVNYFVQIQIGAENEIIWNSPVESHLSGVRFPVKNIAQIENKSLDCYLCHCTITGLGGNGSSNRPLPYFQPGLLSFLFYAYRSR